MQVDLPHGHPAPDVHPESAAIRAALERVLASPDFEASGRNRAFLRYVVEETLAGRDDRIKAYNIAITVFNRDSNFDPQLDSIVRIEAGRLRRALEHYYLTAGRSDPFRISIPKGHYVPMFGPALQPSAQPVEREGRPERGPRIAVAAFLQEGGLDSFPAFARGLTRAIVVGLTRFTDLFVYGPETSHQFGGEPDVRRLREELGVDYLLGGGACLVGDHFTVDAVLIETATGRTVWAESFERALVPAEVDRLRNDVANQLVRVLAQPHGVLFDRRADDVEGKLPASYRLFDYVVRFYQYARGFDRTLYEPVRQSLEEVIARDPDYAEAHACLARVYVDAYRFGFPVPLHVPDPIERATALARRAVDLAPRSSTCRYALGMALWFAKELGESLAELEIGRALNPNDTNILAELGHRYAMQMEWERAVPLLEAAYARNPGQPGIYRIGQFLFEYAHGRYKEALEEARRVGAVDVLYGSIAVAIAAAKLGRDAQSRAALDAVRGMNPDYLQHAKEDLEKRHLHPDLIAMVVEGLHQAAAASAGSRSGTGEAADTTHLVENGGRSGDAELDYRSGSKPEDGPAA
jgi:adenylate cyclase